MFTIADGRKSFYQWDLDRKLIVEDPEVKEVHFCNGTSDCALIREVYKENGAYFVDVPNIILQYDLRIKVYGYDGSATRFDACFDVIKRNKPADYIYTDEELKAWEALEKALFNHIEDYENPHSVAAHQVQGLEAEVQAQIENTIRVQIEPLIEDSIQDAIFDSWEVEV